LDKFQFSLKVNSLRAIETVRDVFSNIQTSPSHTNCSDCQFILVVTGSVLAYSLNIGKL